MQKNMDMTGFFHSLSEAVAPFKHPMHKAPGANVDDCRVSKGVGSNQGNMKFSFIAKDSSVIEVDIHLKSLFANPNDYIENMCNAISDGIEQMRTTSRTLIVAKKPSLMQAH